MKTGDKVILAIGSDSYEYNVQAVSSSGIITVNNKRFNLVETQNDRETYRGMGEASNYRVYDNRDGKIEAHLDPSF